MTWTATLIDAKDRDNHWKIVVEFTDGVKTIERAYRYTGTTTAALKAFVRGQALQLEQTDPVDISGFIGQSIDVTPPPPPDPPTQAEIDRAAWFTDYRQLNQLLRVTESVPALATAQATTLIANLRTSLEADWLNSYLDGI